MSEHVTASTFGQPVGLHRTVSDDLLTAFKMMTPPLHAVAAQALSARDRHAMETVVRLIGYMRGHGYDPDPNNIHQTFYAQWDEVIA